MDEPSIETKEHGRAARSAIDAPRGHARHPGMLDILIRCEILKAAEWLGGAPTLLTRLRGAPKRRLYDALESLGAGRELLRAVGAWLDTWTDDEVLAVVREWNGRAAAEAIDKVRHGLGALKPAARSWPGHD